MNIEQAREVSSRLRKSPIATVTGSFEVADTIDALIAELERLRDIARDAANAATNHQAKVLQLQAELVALKGQEPVAWRYKAVSPFKDSNGMFNVSETWSLLSTPGQIDAHSSMCGMKA